MLDGRELEAPAAAQADHEQEEGPKTHEQALVREKQYEKTDTALNRAGVAGDLVLVYPIETAATIEDDHDALPEKAAGAFRLVQALQLTRVRNEGKKKKLLEGLEDRNQARAKAILKLTNAGLTVVKSRSNDDKYMYVKVSATLERLEQEAERQGIEMMVANCCAPAPTGGSSKSSYPGDEQDRTPDRWRLAEACCRLAEVCGRQLRQLSILVFGATSRRAYKDFSRAERDDFDRLGMGKEGRLFSPLERARMIFAIVEGDSAPPVRGARLDLDKMVSDGVLSAFVFLHSKGHKILSQGWGAMGKIGLGLSVTTRLLANDLMCWTLYACLVAFYAVAAMGGLSETAASTFDIGMGGVLLAFIALAAALGMLVQPLDDVRDYYGEKVAFYFGWMESYSRFLTFLSTCAFVIVILESRNRAARSALQASFCLPFNASAAASSAGGSEAGAAAAQCEAAQDRAGVSGDQAVAWAALAYCLVVAVWTTLFQEGWKRENAVLSHVWDVEDFAEEEDPRPEYLASFYKGRWQSDQVEVEQAIHDGRAHVGKKRVWLRLSGPMETKRGFYTKDRRFIDYEDGKWQKVFPFHYRLAAYMRAIPSLLFLSALMVAGTLSILVFKMLIDVEYLFRGSAFESQGQAAPSALSALWITLMNSVYRYAAVKFNDIENYRTESEYNNSLIFKTIAFQFVNSYSLLLYIAFVKANEWPIGAIFGLYDDEGLPLTDSCGLRPAWPTDQLYKNVNPNCANATSADDCSFLFVRHDCFDDMKQLMFSYTLLRPCYEIPLQILPQIVDALKRLLRTCARCCGCLRAFAWLRRTCGGKQHVVEIASEIASATGRGGTHGLDALGASVTAMDLSEQRKAFHEKVRAEAAQPVYPGTFGEYNTKVVQYGYIAFFSSAFPLAPICAAAGNFIELRIDSLKLLAHRRPRYQGAESIGSWQSVINLISWLALPINVLILTFSSWDFRNLIIVPLVLFSSPSAPGVYSCYDPSVAHLFDAKPMEFVDAFGTKTTLAANATVSHHAQRLGLRTSYLAECAENVQDCYANIGGVWWLPGVEYLPPTAKTTQRYTDRGLCLPSSPLHNEAHCRTCTAWTNAVWRTQLIVAIVIEHLLLLLKIFLAYIIPDQPRWVLDENARRKFHKEQGRNGPLEEGALASDDVTPEDEPAFNAIKRALTSSDDKSDKSDRQETPQRVVQVSGKI